MTSTMIVINVLMSLLALAMLGGGIILAAVLRPGPGDGRAFGRGPLARRAAMAGAVAR